MRFRLALVLAVLSSGCEGAPSFDASSEQACRESISRVTAGVPESKQRRFADALAWERVRRESAGEAVSEGHLCAAFDRMTADEVIAADSLNPAYLRGGVEVDGL